MLSQWRRDKATRTLQCIVKVNIMLGRVILMSYNAMYSKVRYLGFFGTPPISSLYSVGLVYFADADFSVWLGKGHVQ